MDEKEQEYQAALSAIATDMAQRAATCGAMISNCKGSVVIILAEHPTDPKALACGFHALGRGLTRTELYAYAAMVMEQARQLGELKDAPTGALPN